MDADPQQDSGGFVPGAQLLLAPNLPCYSHIAVGTGTPQLDAARHTRGDRRDPLLSVWLVAHVSVMSARLTHFQFLFPPTHPASTGSLSREPAGQWALLRGLGCPFSGGGSLS